LVPFLPRIAEVLLSQPLQLPSAPTWWCGDELSRRHVLSRLDSLVIKPISRRVARSSRFGWELSAAQREELTRRIEAEPYAWVGQQPLTPSTAPTATAGGLEPLPALLRTFAVAQDGGYVVLPGGLSRVAPQAGAITVSNQEGALAKDVWVFATESTPSVDSQVDGPVAGDPVLAAISPRVAEDLFWLGRYAERAESAARLVGVCDNRWRDSSPSAGRAIDDCLAVLLGALAQLSASSELTDSGEPADPATTAPARTVGPEVGAYLLAVLGDESRPGTVAHDARQLRELATAVRDQLSGDTWAVLARLERTLRPFAEPLDPGDIPGALTVILETLLAFAGLAAESMVRDVGWHLLDAGRRIERALQVARLLHASLVARTPAAVEDLVAESVLIAAESIITHRRRYGAGAGIETVLSLLLFDRDNPRGVAYQLDQLAADLRRVAGADPIAAAVDERLCNLNAVLREATAGGLAEPLGPERLALDDMLTTVINELHQLAEAIAVTHFPLAGNLQHFPGLDPVGSLE
jgi:uncharacterized alpha-E superfamily protein